eukprot:scaffold9345_cov120-Cylindrotheca_fusiformis.AAC.2
MFVRYCEQSWSKGMEEKKNAFNWEFNKSRTRTTSRTRLLGHSGQELFSFSRFPYLVPTRLRTTSFHRCISPKVSIPSHFPIWAQSRRSSN